MNVYISEFKHVDINFNNKRYILKTKGKLKIMINYIVDEYVTHTMTT